jgi:hypothetical protein
MTLPWLEVIILNPSSKRQISPSEGENGTRIIRSPVEPTTTRSSLSLKPSLLKSHTSMPTIVNSQLATMGLSRRLTTGTESGPFWSTHHRRYTGLDFVLVLKIVSCVGNIVNLIILLFVF